MFQQVSRHPQADGGRHEDQVEPADQVREHLRGRRDQGSSQLQLRLVQAALRVLRQVRPQPSLTPAGASVTSSLVMSHVTKYYSQNIKQNCILFCSNSGENNK